jgi:formylglycine-generating enzyme
MFLDPRYTRTIRQFLLSVSEREEKMFTNIISRGLLVAFLFVGVADLSLGATHAPWPVDWNNWNDSALWSPVGNPNNLPDTEIMPDGSTGYGSVGYAYSIGKFEVTCGQYIAFLNAKAAVGDPHELYSTSMLGVVRQGLGTSVDPWVYRSTTSDWFNCPANTVCFWDAARYCNWLQNGQKDGDTESGAYINLGNSSTFARQPNAQYFIPTENEWYKAAYQSKYDDRSYCDYPTGQGLGNPPHHDLRNVDPGDSANFWDQHYASPNYLTVVGDYENSESWYGTFDQGGNVWEWCDSAPGALKTIRGGSASTTVAGLESRYRMQKDPSAVFTDSGFRIVYVPEPSGIVLFITGILGLIACVWRRRR